MNTAYIAGLIDGEGYFGIQPNRNKNLKTISFSPVLKIGMTESTAKDIMYQLKEQYGGAVEFQARDKQPNRRPCWLYVAKSQKRVMAIIEDVYPFLIVKKAQAELIKEFCSLPLNHTRYGNYDYEMSAIKLEMYEKMRNLKKPESLATTE